MTTTWIISANGKMYDHASSFASNGFIDWRQGNIKYSVGDIVYIYCTKPLSRVMFKCLVEKEGMLFSEIIDDKRFWHIQEEYERAKGGYYFRLRLIEQVDTPLLDLEHLKEHGLKAAPQNPTRVKEELIAYIETHFDDCYSTGFFTDEDASRKYFEGHVKQVVVNKYERSSIARRKCIEAHGPNCAICKINFGERYGDFAEGFIHVHHLKPLHTIASSYVVDYENDLIPVCPNCHAMIHRLPGGESMSLQELKARLGRKHGNGQK